MKRPSALCRRQLGTTAFMLSVVSLATGAPLLGAAHAQAATAIRMEPGTSAPPVATMALTASANPAPAGEPVTMTATVVGAGAFPAGTVQFQVGGVDIGTPVALSGTATRSGLDAGVATATTTFSVSGTQTVTAVFTPAASSPVPALAGTYSQTVAQTAPDSGSEPLAVTVPPRGAFTLTSGVSTVNLTVSGLNATGLLDPITVSDTRNTFPGWSLSGQASNFAGSGAAAGGDISGDQLGWTPSSSDLGAGVVLGSAVAPGGPGLGSSAATLALAVPGKGFGTSALNAGLNLAIPPTAPAGPYTSALTVTAVTVGP